MISELCSLSSVCFLISSLANNKKKNLASFYHPYIVFAVPLILPRLVCLVSSEYTI